MRVKSIAVALAVAAFLFSSFAQADPESEARAHYQSATTHFAVGDFAKAADEYQAAYMLKPDPALLYNAAQAYRLAGNQDKALILYKNYVQLYPHESNVEEVHAQIAKLKEAIAASNNAKTAPPTGTKEPTQATGSGAASTATPAAVTPPATPPEAATAPSSEAATETHERTPLYKKWWLWTIVGGVVVAGVVTGVVLATSSKPAWNNAPEIGPGRMALEVRW